MRMSSCTSGVLRARAACVTRIVVLCCATAFLCLTSAASASRSAGDGGWYSQSSGTTNSLAAVDFTDATHGWAATWGGAILATTDGGVVWKRQNTSTSQNLEDVVFVDALHGWAIGSDGVILATVTGGTTWNTVNAGVPLYSAAIEFVDALHGWAVGSGRLVVPSPAIYSTSDGGVTWTARNPAVASGLVTAVDFVDDSHGWAVTSRGAILATSNGGGTWRVQESGTSAMLWGVAFADVSHGWAVGDAGTVLATVDGGASWDFEETGATENLSDVACAGVSRVWAVGFGGAILASTNGGSTWIRQRPGSSSNLWGVAFVDSSHGWVVGNDGAILATTTGGFERVPPSSVSALTSPSHPVPTTPYANANPAFTWTAATDAGSGVAGYSFVLDQNAATVPDAIADGIETFATFWGKPEGTWYFHVRAVDVAGNAGLTSHLAVLIDMGGAIDVSAPSASASGPTSGWHNHRLTLKFSATDDAGGVGVDFTEYRVDTRDWRRGAQVTIEALASHANDGVHTISYRAVDKAGNASAARAATVRIDTRKPTPKARRRVSVRRGAMAKLYYRITDGAPGCGAATVTIKVKNRSLKVVKTLRLGRKPTNRTLAKSFRCTLPRGAYKYFVYATDAAGNRCRVPPGRSRAAEPMSDPLVVR